MGTTSNEARRSLSNVCTLDCCQPRVNKHGSTGWWNNHSGGFIKMALIEGVPGNVGREGKAALLANENSKFLLPYSSERLIILPFITI